MTDPATGQQQGQQGATTFSAEEVARKEANWREAVGRHEAAAKAAEQKLAEITAQHEAAAKAAREKEMTEVEKAKARVAEIEAEKVSYQRRVQETAVSAAIKVEAIRAGIDPDVAARLFDTSSVTYDDKTNTVSGVTDGVKAMLEKYPYLQTGKAVPAAPPPHNSRAAKHEEKVIPTYSDQRRADFARLHGMKL